MATPQARLAQPGYFLPSEQFNELTQSSPDWVRSWRGFLSARVTIGLLLLLFEIFLAQQDRYASWLLIGLSGLYLAATLAARLLMPPRPLGNGFSWRWLATAGVDILTFATLQAWQGQSISFTPLYAMPVLLAAVLGPLLTALGTAASITLLLLNETYWLAQRLHIDATGLYIQTALTSTGGFVIAILAHQLADRLARQEQRARQHQLAAQLQQRVNELVTESTSDGILVVDTSGRVHAANPAARQMLLPAPQQPEDASLIDLHAKAAWQGLVELTRQSLKQQTPLQIDLTLTFADEGPRRLRARTRLTDLPLAPHLALCLVFLQDLRELEARVRADKLASMGRMSVAVAHEIRNPLAAITQANALLAEDLSDARQRQLTSLVQQNARRLAAMVEDILDVSRVQGQGHPGHSPALDLHVAVGQICADWSAQDREHLPPVLVLCADQPRVLFEPEHLRRVLLNLLDNAQRYASGQPDSIQVWTRMTAPDDVDLGVWSDGPPIEPSVERHLFEPFFSSESRSSGLGLFLSRELCEGHGATLAYRRVNRPLQGTAQAGNEFFVSLRLEPWH